MNCVRLVEYIRHAGGQIKMYTLQIRQCTAEEVQCKQLLKLCPPFKTPWFCLRKAEVLEAEVTVGI